VGWAVPKCFWKHQEVFAKPPTLAALVSGRPLILYISAQDASLGALLAEHNDEGKEVACYYLSRTLVGAEINYSGIEKLCLSRTLVGAEINYSGIEKLCLALIFALKKLRHYMLSHEVQLVARADPVKYVSAVLLFLGGLANGQSWWWSLTSHTSHKKL
jgi:hypothetical protein